MYPQPPARKFTRAERLTLIDLRVPGEAWQKGQITMMFQRIVSEPWALDMDDDIDEALESGDFLSDDWDGDY